MTLRSLLLCCAALAAACFLTPEERPTVPEVRRIDAGVDLPCAPGFAHVEMPRRDAATPLAPLHDLAYAAAAAGPEGCLWLLGAVALVALLSGLWSHGLRGALRRVVLAAALGGPVGLALLYTSCLLDGRVIRLGAEASEYVPASLHNHTTVSTGLLSPRDLVIWHAKRGFRVLNVSDKDTVEGGVLAREAAREIGPFTPPLLVIVGDEWHGQPDICFLNVTRDHGAERKPVPARATPEERRALRLDVVAEVAASVHGEGGALWIAHPWSKVPAELSLEDLLKKSVDGMDGVDGVEVVNGVVHGGEARIRTAVEQGKTLFGVLDYKYGPHVNTMTLLDARLATTPEGVVEAVREGRPVVVYAVPGGARSNEEFKAYSVGLRGAWDGLRSLRETPRARRAVWFAWGMAILVLWWLTTRDRKGAPRNAMRKGTAHALFAACAAGELLLLLFVWSEVRVRLVTVPVPILVGVAALLAVPLLAASHSLAVTERHA